MAHAKCRGIYVKSSAIYDKFFITRASQKTCIQVISATRYTVSTLIECLLKDRQTQVPRQDNLGVMYGTRQGVPQDYVQAHKWFNLSAAKGVSKARENRDTAANRMSQDQIAEAQKLAREWKPKQ